MTFNHHRVFRIALVCLLFSGEACTERDRKEGDAAASDSLSPGVAARETIAVVPDPLPEVAARRMRWNVGAIIEALEAAGLQQRGAPQSVAESFLSAPGNRILFSHPGGGEAELQVFIYGDAGAVARDLAGLDTVRVAPRGRNIDWRVPATLLTDNNLILIMLTEDSRIRETVRQTILQP